MYNQEEAAGWADGQLNENNERTDDLDGAAEGENDTRISASVVQNQTAAPSRPKSRDSYYDRDMRERGEPPEYYGSGRARNRGHGGGEGVPRRRTRNESYRDGDRSRMEDYDYGYRGGGSRYPAGPMPPDRWYPDPYYGAHMGQGYGAGGSRGGYGVQPPGYMSNVKEMLERLRVEDPRRYRQWYEQYQAHRRNPHRVPDPGLPYFGAASMGGHPPSTPYGPNYGGWQGGNSSVYAESGTNERQSVHSDVGRPSGRSSVNDEIMKLSMSGIAFNQGLSQTPSINQDPDAGFRSLHEHYHVSPEPRRMTPLKYNTSHCLGVLTPLGHLIKVKNEGATIEIVQVKSLLCHLPEFSKVSAFPGPLKKDTTHKNTLIQFCQKKIKEIRTNEKQADKDNFILLWELLILLLRKNGNVFGSDVSELLLKKNAANSDDTSSADESQSKNASSDEDEEEESANHVKVEASNCTPINEVKASEKFCEFLLYGHKKEALDYAMNNGLWGHALFLATKMDERTYGSVLARFANCTPFNHPLQTFYQLMSGRQPASAKSCCDESFGDWRPHLAMILSNAGSRPEVEFNSINKMGDTLGAKGHTFAAQFCYLMSQTDFSSRTKLGPLLGLSSEADNIIEATQMTEIYEFARSLQDPSFTVGPSFFKSKLNYTKTLLDLGFIEEAFAYCEEMGKKLKMLNNSKGHDEHEIETVKWSVLQISERLVRCEDSEYEGEPTWLQELRSEIAPGKPSLEINSEQRRDSTVLENGTHEIHEALSQQPPPYGIEQQQQQQQNPDYAPELKGNVMPEPVQPLNVVDSTNFQPNGPYDIPMYNPGANQLPPMNQQQQPIQPPVGIDQQQPQQQQQHQQQQQLQQQQHQQQQLQQQQQHQQQQQQHHQPQITMDNGPQHYLQPQTPYGALPNPNMNQDNTIQNQPPQPSYGSQPPALDNYGGQQQFPEYMSNHNNNYITPGNGYNTYGQLPPLTDGPPPGPIGANKKKSVRFEDDEHLEDSDDTSPLGQTLKQIAMRSDEGDKFSFCHPIKASVRNNYVGYNKENSNRDLADQSRFDYQRERSESAGGEQRLSSDEIMEEIERLTSSRSFNGSFVPTRTTYPIDEPIESLPLISRPSFLGLKKTFPIDKHCCNENQLCKDHDNYYHGSTGSGSVASSPSTPSSSSHPKIQGSNGSLTGAGSNASFSQGKGMDGPAHKMPPMMNNHKPGPQFQDNSAQNNKAGAGGGKQGNNKAGGGGDGKQQSSGWFGSILGKLSIKAPNQMILPDDKEPTIVWDPNQKKWVNTKGDEDDDSGPKGPPPSDGDLMRMQQGGGVQRPPMMQQPPPMMGGGMPPMMQQPQQNQHPSMMPPHGNFQPNPNNPPNGMPQLGPNVPSYPQTQQQPQAGLPNPQEQQQQNFGGYPNQQQQPPNQQPNPQVNPGFNNGGPNMNGPTSLPPTGNKYKLPKNRPIRTGYVDVLNPNANAPSPGGPMGNGGNMMSPAGGAPNVPNMFIPSPISGSGDSGPVSFLTPAPPGPLPAQSQLEATTN